MFRDKTRAFNELVNIISVLQENVTKKRSTSDYHASGSRKSSSGGNLRSVGSGKKNVTERKIDVNVFGISTVSLVQKCLVLVDALVTAMDTTDQESFRTIKQELMDCSFKLCVLCEPCVSVALTLQDLRASIPKFVKVATAVLAGETKDKSKLTKSKEKVEKHLNIGHKIQQNKCYK
eukprot:TRINITY_DN4175_c0_g1_i13.p1 TRINITY_DN4175_c0_g1~~TRINITY_DN4175_c0_g1_i13.p1  ORF type:complete len:177 (-),score=38.06 TRINITY_DN4175_c0_g1_i13:460-990(-)